MCSMIPFSIFFGEYNRILQMLSFPLCVPNGYGFVWKTLFSQMLPSGNSRAYPIFLLVFFFSDNVIFLNVFYFSLNDKIFGKYEIILSCQFTIILNYYLFFKVGMIFLGGLTLRKSIRKS